MTRSELISIIRQRKSFLCVGLDTDPEKIPSGISVLDFNKAIIDATRDLCVAYKPNLAFYERMGVEGWQILHETVKYIGNHHFTIADAKRGDIGNTGNYYAQTFFETYGFDSVTVAPYMGSDSIKPFLQHNKKWAIILALTSNDGAADFQLQQAGDEVFFEAVLRKTKALGSDENIMYVVGATRPEMLIAVRKIVPSHFLLVPGVGAQGGNLADVCNYGLNTDCGLLVNASRSILYADNSIENFAKAARQEALRMQREMSEILLTM